MMPNITAITNELATECDFLCFFPPQKINEEQTLRQDLQVKLLQSEQQLQQLRQNLGAAPNGLGSEFADGANANLFSPSTFGGSYNNNKIFKLPPTLRSPPPTQILREQEGIERVIVTTKTGFHTES